MTSAPSARERKIVVALLAAATIVALVVGELLVRTAIRCDADGQSWFRGIRLRPYRLPLLEIGRTLERLQSGDSFLAYDAELGWAPRPRARSRDGTLRVDSGGIRTDGETTTEREGHGLRIALFGDSFTLGDEVAQGDTWGVALERALAVRGVSAEVLNFGVNAYGMDQAYLRWARHGRRYRPDVVVFGFQGEDAMRNVNVFRPVYFMQSEVPLSKPRFVEREGDLVLLNVPTIPPEQLLRVLAALEDDPLLAYERFYAPAFAPQWWLRMRTAAVLVALFGAEDPWRLDAETRSLAGRIVEAFARDVEASGAAFLLVDLPRREDIAALRRGGTLWYGGLLDDFEKRWRVAHPLAAVSAEAMHFAPRGHYGPGLNRAIGDALATPVLDAWNGGRRAR